MRLIETRGNDGKKAPEVSFSEAILSPMASYGGLYAPKTLPKFDEEFLNSHLTSDYKSLAKDVLKRFDIDISDELIDKAISRYDEFDDKDNPVPVVKLEDNLYISELFHGPTRAFKDMALQPFGVILSELAKQRGERYLIMAATSGDTGPATLETFKNKENIEVVCLYPEGGTSDVQRLQMVTEDAPNLHVLGIKGDFDDAQAALKSLLSSKEFNEFLKRKELKLSAANSVNFGRIIFQTIYHIHSYLELVRQKAIEMGEEIDLIVPSGNFGNALGAYYIKKAGVPIKKIIIASNENNILTEFIKSGVYDLRNKKLIQTNSPAMDILKSSNVERVLFDKFGAARTKELMESLNKNLYYKLTPDELKEIQKDFDATFSTQKEVLDTIKEYILQKNYIMDPHTATTIKAFKEKNSQVIPMVAYSTAEWTKFSPVIAQSLGLNVTNDKEALNLISARFNVKITDKIVNLFKKRVVHLKIIEKNNIMRELIDILN
ncbi:MAG: threonine synthase [Epsilonproteobacteria bacterium]|nr:threonine synthase [Campylobacterota bacterium]